MWDDKGDPKSLCINNNGTNSSFESPFKVRMRKVDRRNSVDVQTRDLQINIDNKK